jgi:hypothetical protein
VPVGDVRSGFASVPAGGSLDIRPSASEEWVIHNIYHEFDIDIAVATATDELVFDTDIGAGAYIGFAFHVTNTQWIRVKNKDMANARKIAYDGVVTKGP